MVPEVGLDEDGPGDPDDAEHKYATAWDIAAARVTKVCAGLLVKREQR